jgi:asparagine synthase (glutamine-hydrolysing)
MQEGSGSVVTDEQVGACGSRSRALADLALTALGHVRLSIIDLSPEGNQPFHDEQDDIHAVVNGELYGYEKYRQELSSEFNFRGNSDCEIVIALYKHYGIGFLDHLRGEFAVVLYDAKRELFFAARDRYGIKSLYYTIYDGRLLVATEMKSFLSFGWKPEWDVRSLREAGWVNSDRTIFKGVKKVT